MERILVATDLSEASNEAIRQAHAFASSTGARLGVCHVLPSLMMGANPLFPQQNQADSARAAELEAAVRTAVELRVGDLTNTQDVDIFVEQGSEYAEIVRRAEAWSADLVVLGSHGRTALARLFLGSVAEQVVRHAHCPVLIARPIAKPGIVLAATDLSDPSLPALMAGAAEAKRRGAQLIVVHAMELSPRALPTMLGAPFGAASFVTNQEVNTQAHEALEIVLRQALERTGAVGETRIVEGPPAAAIVRVAEELGPELLVVGTRGRTGLSRVALGSVAERVIRLAPCSVLAARATG